MSVITSKFKEVLFSVLPITVLVLILNLTISPMDGSLIIRFILGSILIVFGLTVFLLGVDIGITPLGALTGSSLAKTNKLSIVLVVGALVGFFISIAEPGLLVLSEQVNTVTGCMIRGAMILFVVSVGLAIMLSLGFLRIFYNIPLYKILIVLYALIFIISIGSSKEFLAIAFDASGSTTGIMAVPFILSLSVGISKLKKDSKASEKDSFGLVAIASTGAIISVLIVGMFFKVGNFSASLEKSSMDSSSVLSVFAKLTPMYIRDSFVTIIPLLAILIIFQKIWFKLKKRELRKILTGFIFSFLGLFIFLLGVNAGFMDVGTMLGNNLALMNNKAWIVGIGFLLGVVTILAEPAVYVLTSQIEDITSGHIHKNAVLIPLAIGVGSAVALSVVRILSDTIQLWHYLLPGYIICIVLMFFIPKLFVGIAFDAGGVATGPITATFILAFVQGAANAFEGADLMADGFGMIAMVAMMPILTLEILGLMFSIMYKIKTREKVSTDE